MSKLLPGLYLAIGLLFNFSSYAQTSNASETQKILANYFKNPRELIFLHLNKTDFIKNESIWFQGYISNQFTGLPFEQTRNVHITIYNSLGEPVKHQLFLANQGYLRGNIKVDSLFTDGSYYLKANTNWMRNFSENDGFVEKINVLEEKNFQPKMEKLRYDVQFLPEGGNLLANTQNVIGVKSNNSLGYGVNIKNAKILTSKNKVVTEFETEIHGLGKFIITPEKDEKYKAEVEFEDGRKFVYFLPIAEREGISLELKNNHLQDKIALSFNTNNATVENGKKDFYFILHQNRKSSVKNFSLQEGDLTKSFYLEKDELETGVNILTLFNADGKPILERQFFNNYGIENPKVALKKKQIIRDSIKLTFRIENGAKGFNLSASTLPSETTNSPRNSILSQFYLEPFIQGFVENPLYYFSDISGEKLYHLDLLLLTQGWSKYSWKDIFNEKNDLNYEFEYGLSLTGTLQDKKERPKQILFHTSKYHMPKRIDLPEGEKTFIINNLFIEDEEKLGFSVLRNNDKLRKPGIYLRINQAYDIEKFSEKWQNNPLSSTVDISQQTLREFARDFKSTTLDTVNLEGKKKDIIPVTQPMPGYLENKVTMVDRDLIRIFPEFYDLLRSKGYIVREGIQAFNGGSPTAALSRVQVISRRRSNVQLILNGIRMPNFDELMNVPLSRIESFYFDRLGSFEGARSGLNEIIYVFTRMGKTLEEINNPTKFDNILYYSSDIGFKTSKERYTPKYSEYRSEAYQKYGMINWTANIQPVNNQFTITIPNLNLDEVKVYLEGMSFQGELISKEMKLEL